MESILCLLSLPRDGIRENFLNLTSSPVLGVVPITSCNRTGSIYGAVPPARENV